MDLAARRYARNILLWHLVLLAAVITIVFFAARNVYDETRAEALNEAAHRQEFLATQTARGIESFYQSILDNLDLLRRSDSDSATSPALSPGPIGPRALLLGPILWKQLEDR